MTKTEVVSYRDIRSAEGCRYDAVTLGEVMLRLDPRDAPVARMRDAVRVFQGGGETNLACGLTYTFGLRAAVLTALVADDIGANIRNQLREAGVDNSTAPTPRPPSWRPGISTGMPCSPPRACACSWPRT